MIQKRFNALDDFDKTLYVEEFISSLENFCPIGFSETYKKSKLFPRTQRSYLWSRAIDYLSKENTLTNK